MSDERPERHLAAIVVADVVGYCRLIEADEVATLAALKRRREEIIEPLARDFKGRAVKFMGDGVLLEFASAVNAVEFSTAFQDKMAAANAGDLEKADITFRIGVNLGDIVIENGDVFGEGVNIAARLEAMADPGRVLVSDSVFRQVKGRIAIGFEDLGEQRLKNVSDPVRVYLVEARSVEHTFERAAADHLLLQKTDKISIAVLPFDNMSGDDKEIYFSDGITEDIITELSRFRELRVIARNSSFQFRGGKNDIREIGRKLDTKFVIEGSVRRAANRVRITVQLIEAASNGHIWSDRYDREVVDVFEIQEEIARTIATRVAGHTRASTVERIRTRPIESFSAYDLFLRARQMSWSYGGDNGLHALAQAELLLKVIELDPQFAAAYGMLADDYTVQFLRTGDRSLLEKAMEFGRQGVAADREDGWASYGLGLALIYGGALPDAGFYLKRAIDLNPNDVSFLGVYALWLNYVGRGDEARATIKEAIRRDPYGQEWFWAVEGNIFTIQGLYHEAVQSYAKMSELPCWNRCFLAFDLTKCGDRSQAKAVIKDFRSGTPNLGPSALMDAILPEINPDFRKDFLDTLRSIETGLFDGASSEAVAR